MGNCLKAICTKKSIPLLDLYSMMDFTMETDPKCDWVHPTKAFVKENVAPSVFGF